MNPEPPKTVATLRAAIASLLIVTLAMVGRSPASLKPPASSWGLQRRCRLPVDGGQGGGYIAGLARPALLGLDAPVALVAELVDAQVSGTCDRKVVEVRVFSWAPTDPATWHPPRRRFPRTDGE